MCYVEPPNASARSQARLCESITHCLFLSLSPANFRSYRARVSCSECFKIFFVFRLSSAQSKLAVSLLTKRLLLLFVFAVQAKVHQFIELNQR